MLRKHISGCQYPEIQLIVLYIQKLSETQLEPSGARKPQRRWVSLDFLFSMPSMGQAESCVTFQHLGDIRSTQPTGLAEGGFEVFKVSA